MMTNILCQGDDAETFLQGQLTCDVTKVNQDSNQLCAHCNAQGRVIFTAIITKIENGFSLSVIDEIADIALSSLKKYGAFSKIAFNKEASTKNLFDNHIAQAIPVIYPETSGLFVAQRLNLHLLGAISFRKGCYIGQEILARLHFKGKVKHHMRGGETLDQTQLQPGDLLTNSDGKNIATVIDSQTTNSLQKLLLVIMDKDAQSEIFTASKSKIDLLTPPYSLQEN